jgi:hypothetical protein
MKEFIKVDVSGSVCIEVGDQLVDCLVLGFETQ